MDVAFKDFTLTVVAAPECTVDGEKICENGIEYTCTQGKWVETGTCAPEIPWVLLAAVGGAVLIGIALLMRSRKES